jgi:hypothetical protein
MEDEGIEENAWPKARFRGRGSHLASADPDNPEEWLEFLQQQGECAGDRIRTELKRLQALGIIDPDLG